MHCDKGLPIDKALHPDTMLAWAQNGQMLEHLHGAPVCLLVPGWSGNWSVQWLTKREVMDDVRQKGPDTLMSRATDEGGLGTVARATLQQHAQELQRHWGLPGYGGVRSPVHGALSIRRSPCQFLIMLRCVGRPPWNGYASALWYPRSKGRPPCPSRK